jgi:antitoxin VapB
MGLSQSSRQSLDAKKSPVILCSQEATRKEVPLNIRNPEAEELAAELAKQTGETKTEAVIKALRDRLDRVRRERSKRRLQDVLEEIAEHAAKLPELDPRSPDEIIGYDENGLPR